ncbi:hypothetical protein KFL_001770260 [Klebsormidium nitens]|uniref:Thylakoid membrane protein slr0575 n=1 Tax=Klebsormidium nitens TaxID=105231 RepID=A0A1Y1HZM9_KLENI|nr:hypothetical protein KFL_001770260 [Klebsormidium nitens]|eukprot:GAQ84140.1 hypothetical protein KFL_001770260 [Klebsormidium nitens]
MAASLSAAAGISPCFSPCARQHAAASSESLAASSLPLRHASSCCIAPSLGLPAKGRGALGSRSNAGKLRRPARVVVAQAGETGVTSSTGVTSKGKEIVPDNDFNVAKVSFGTVGAFLGVGLLTFGFGSYFQLTPGGDFSALLLTYGFPLFLIGCALKYAELKPVPLISYADAYALRSSQATPILEQVRNDVTRYRYGDEQHLEEALKRIFRYGQGGGISRRDAPVLTAIREEVQNGRYTLALIFDSKLSKEQWEEKQAKFTSFFGPGVTADILEAGNNVFEVKLVADGGPK